MERAERLSHSEFLSPAEKRPKVALLLNIISPARVRLYSLLADQFDLMVLHGGTEANRDSWSGVESALSNARVVRAWGWQFHYVKKLGNEDFDDKYIHLTPGYFWHLFRFRPHIIITNEMGFRSLLALVYGTAFRRPVWIWSAGTPHSERAIGPLRKALRKILSVWAEYWISYGDSATEYLLSLGIKRERILQSQNAVDERRFQALADPLWDIAPRPVVLYAGQFIERKGVGALLDAAARLQREGCRFSLLLVGSGRDRPAIERRVKSMGIENVHFRAVQTPDKMPAVYRSADVMVLPTHEDVWGLVANEAILCGTPVLCSKHAGCAKELFPPENIFAPEDMDEFCSKLRGAISGNLPTMNPDRLRTTHDLGSELVRELNKSLPTSASTLRPNKA